MPGKPGMGIIIKEGDSKYWYALGLTTDGKSLQGLVKADFSSPGNVLSYRARAPFPERVANPQPAPPAIVNSILKDAAAINAFTRKPDAVERLAAAMILAFFFCTLWFFPRLGRWPLLGALIGLVAFRLGLLFVAIATSSGFASISASYFPAAVGRWLPHACMGIIGGIVLVADILSTVARKGREGRAA